MELLDFFLAPIYLLFLTFFVLRRGKKIYAKETELYKHYKNSFYLKILGAVSFAMIYQFYYKGGDTMCFFFWTRAISQTLFQEPTTWFNYIFLDDFNAYHALYRSPWAAKAHHGIFNCFWIFKYGGSDSFFMKISSFITMLGGNLYLPTSLLFATLSFFGTWRLFLVFKSIFPNHLSLFSKSILYIPSLIFWGSGFLKDSLTFACLGFLTYALYFGLIKNEKIIKHLIQIFIVGYIITIVKGYIILAFVPGALYWVMSAYKNKISNSALRALITPVFISIAVLFSVLIITNISSSAGRFSLDHLEKTATDYQTWHTIASEGGSGYSLGGVTEDFTLSVLLLKFPLAVNVTLFRPYLWEARNVVMLLSSLESTAILFFTLITIFKVGVFNSIRIISSNSLVIFCLFFALFFAFAVGFTSYNFGALVRYKIPCIPFYLAAISAIRVYSGVFPQDKLLS